MPLEPVSLPGEIRGLRIGLLVSGGIAAYKLADLASAMTQAGCAVRVAMSAAASRFIGAATFRGVTGNPVLVDLWAPSSEPEPHVQLGDWAQLLLLAPATANTIAKLAEGRADDIVSATVLAARGPLVLAPAMNDAMWAKPQVQENLDRLRAHGALVVEPEAGHLASGHLGAGRLASGQRLLDALAEALGRQPRYLSATVRRGRGGLLLTPIAVVAADRVIVPDLAPGDGTEDLTAASPTTSDPLTEALQTALALLAEIAHRGAHHLPPTFPTRLEAVARALHTAGLTRGADDLRTLIRTLAPAPGQAAFDAWADAAIRLITTAECR